jgi:hypothetical protein
MARKQRPLRATNIPLRVYQRLIQDLVAHFNICSP